MQRLVGLLLSHRSLVVAIVTFLIVAIVAALGAALYATYMVMPVITARRTFLHQLTGQGGSFVAFYGKDPCGCSPWERDSYHLKEISSQTLGGSWNLARDWALWRMTAVSLELPQGVSLGEGWITKGLAVMPPVCRLEFNDATITAADVSVLLSAHLPILRGPSVRSVVFKRCTFAVGALESFLQKVPPQVWIALSSCEITGEISDREGGNGEPRKQLYGLTLARMKLEDQQWRSLFSRVACQNLQVSSCEGLSDRVWNEILGMSSLQWAELGFDTPTAVAAFVNSSTTNASLKELSIHMHDVSLTESFSECVKAIAARFPRVTALMLSTLEISDDSLRHLANFHHLEKLVLYADQIMGDLKTLEDCPALRSVKLYARHLSTDALIDRLKDRGVEVYYERINSSVLP